MASACRIFANVSGQSCILRCQKLSYAQKLAHKKLFHIMPPLRLREVYENTEDKTKTVIEGKKMTSERAKALLKLEGPKDACPLCRLNMNVKYTDILIVSQFVQEDGNIIPRAITGLCDEQHLKMKKLIHQAHRAGLMQSLKPNVFPEGYSHMADYKWKKYNVYFTDAMDDY